MNNNGFYTNNYNFASARIIATGFSYASPELLRQIKQYFGLSADITALMKTQRYFSSVEMRDPYAEELRLIDKILTDPKKSPRDVLLTALSSEDIRVGEAFDDMRQKFKAIDPDSSPYYSIEDILNAGKRSLSALGKRAPQKTKMISGNNALIKAALIGNGDISLIRSANGKNCAITTTDITASSRSDSVLDSDSIIFIKSSSETVKEEQFDSLLAGLTVANRKSSTVKSLIKIGEDGLIGAFLKSSGGAFVDLSPLYSLFYNINVDFLLEEIKSSAIAIIPTSSVAQFIESANSCGLWAYIIGRPSKVGRLTIVSKFGISYSLSTDFLKSLKTKSGMSAKVQKHLATPQKNSEEFSLCTMNAGIVSEYAAIQNGMLITNVDSGTFSFDGAALTFLEAVCRMVSCGVSYENILASFDVGVNINSEYDAGDSIAASLGLYRVQAELCIVSYDVECKASKKPSLSVTLTAKINGNSKDRHFTKAGSKVYLLAPRYDENGLPDFRDERLLLSYVNRLYKENAILSVRAVGGDGIYATLQKMQNDDVAELKIAEQRINSGIGSFIVESDTELSGLLLGFTE